MTLVACSKSYEYTIQQMHLFKTLEEELIRTLESATFIDYINLMQTYMNDPPKATDGNSLAKRMMIYE